MKKLIVISILSISLIISLVGMLEVSFTFRFMSDEKHILFDSLWAVDEQKVGASTNIESIYNDYFDNKHYPKRGGHPNGIVLILGPFIWLLSLIKELNIQNIQFFVLSIRILLIGASFASLYFLYLFLKELDEENGARFGKIAVAISAIFPPFVAYGSIRAMDTMSMLFMMITLWSFMRLIRNPSLLFWIIPGIFSGIFLILKKSGLLIIPLLIIFGLLLSKKIERNAVIKKLLFTIILSITVLVITNNPLLYFGGLLWPEKEAQDILGSSGIQRFGLLGFQFTKMWEFLHPDYYYYLGYRRHAAPLLKTLAIFNRHFTMSFYLIYFISLFLLMWFRKWKMLMILNIPIIILFLSLPNFKAYRFLPVFPLALSTIAAALILFWQRFKALQYRVAFVLFYVSLFLINPAYRIFSVQTVGAETYLDLGELAAKNRHLNFTRGILYDRYLLQWKTDRLDKPFQLIPRNEGVMVERLKFKESGEYWIGLLISNINKDTKELPSIEVVLGNQEKYVDISPDSLKWYFSGPFIIGNADDIYGLSIHHKGSGSESTQGITAFFDIRIAETGKVFSKKDGNFVLPIPWWISNDMH